ncbi:hypothetical protein AKJ08_1615 [Vulgatibacter incomptus]|uniref:Uncharacterized protein n=1 Tax=Vulgatibacter incomptus TaxID=1391653 RepID=A0A0K1PCH2_9BACT|nr:hypothetical protein AKJ08_1615 [Vulgatibacter incomptus]
MPNRDTSTSIASQPRRGGRLICGQTIGKGRGNASVQRDRPPGRGTGRSVRCRLRPLGPPRG